MKAREKTSMAVLDWEIRNRSGKQLVKHQNMGKFGMNIWLGVCWTKQ